MKKKLALLMAAIMTVAMVPMTAFASTKLIAVDEISTAVDEQFTSTVELRKNDDQVDIDEGKYDPDFEVILKLTNGKFTKDDDDEYIMQADNVAAVEALADALVASKDITQSVADDFKVSITKIDVKNDTTAYVSLVTKSFNKHGVGSDGAANKVDSCVLPIVAKAVETGDVTATFTSNVTQFKKASEVIATAYADEVAIESEGVITFVEDATKDTDEIKDITINGLVNDAIDGTKTIKLKLSGNFEFVPSSVDKTETTANKTFSFLNSEAVVKKVTVDEDEIEFTIDGLEAKQLTKLTISGIKITTTKKCNAGDKATITVSSKNFNSVKLEVARMVEEAVTYTVEDDDLPVIWAGKNYAVDAEDDTNTLEVTVEENTGDILNTSRKATFTFPEGIEVVDIDVDTKKELKEANFSYQIDENVLTIWNYAKGADESKNKADFGIKFLLNAAPSYNGDVAVTLGGEFDDVELKVATVKAPYTVEAKTTEVLIDYRYVPVNEIVITEAEEGLLEDGMKIALEVEKMDFEDAGTYEVTEGDIDVDVTIEDDNDSTAQLEIEIKDESTEASTIKITGLELYLDRTLPVGGYALKNVMPEDGTNILWQNSTDRKEKSDDTQDQKVLSYDYTPKKYTEDNKDNVKGNGLFKYKALTVNDSYVEVVTQARDQDDSTTNRKIVITIGATTMAVGTETITLDTPAYINAENYTELPLRAVSEAFGATVNWDDASRTVTIMMGQRIVSMTIGSKTMYINGTPVAMNTAPEITNERTFVPVRDLANALGISKIDWNEASATVTLN